MTHPKAEKKRRKEHKVMIKTLTTRKVSSMY